MLVVRYTETSANFHRTTRRHISEDIILRRHRREILKSKLGNVHTTQILRIRSCFVLLSLKPQDLRKKCIGHIN
jgi:hypothetical protein